MTDAATTPTPTKPPSPAREEGATAKVVQLRAKVQEGADALNGWAHDQARTIASAAKEKPLTAAGVSAGAAFAAGVLLGLLLSRAAAPPQPSWKDRLMELKPSW